MFRFLAALMLCAALPSAAFAQASPTPSAMKHDSMKGGAMKHDSMKGGAMKHDAMKGDAMKPAPKPTP